MDAKQLHMKHEIANRDAKAKRIMELLSEGYAETSGKVIDETEAARKAQEDEIKRRIEAGEIVDPILLLQYGFAKANQERKTKEAQTTMNISADQL